jgi:hypothetical protein
MAFSHRWYLHFFDPSFIHTPSLATYVRKTFEKVRREQGEVHGRLKLVKSSENVEVLKLEQFKGASPARAAASLALHAERP